MATFEVAPETPWLQSSRLSSAQRMRPTTLRQWLWGCCSALCGAGTLHLVWLTVAGIAAQSTCADDECMSVRIAVAVQIPGEDPVAEILQAFVGAEEEADDVEACGQDPSMFRFFVVQPFRGEHIFEKTHTQNKTSDQIL